MCASKGCADRGDGRNAVLCLAGFGDDATMFVPLVDTELAAHYRLVAENLPGFGGAAPLSGTTSLARLAEEVNGMARREGAAAVMAHSVASVIASLAVHQDPTVIQTIISLEGNLTAADGFFTSMAADFGDPAAFHRAFLARLDAESEGDGILGRYRDVAAVADPRALGTGL